MLLGLVAVSYCCHGWCPHSDSKTHLVSRCCAILIWSVDWCCGLVCLGILLMQSRQRVKDGQVVKESHFQLPGGHITQTEIDQFGKQMAARVAAVSINFLDPLPRLATYPICHN